MDADELRKRIRALEEGQAELKRDISKLLRPPPERRGHQRADSSSPSRRTPQLATGPGGCPPGTTCMMAMQSLGHAAHVIDLRGQVLFWNRSAECLYGYSSAEAVGQGITNLIVHPDDIPALSSIIGNIFTGKCWRGKFPVKKKSGERFFVLADATPLHDDDGRMINDGTRLSHR